MQKNECTGAASHLYVAKLCGGETLRKECLILTRAASRTREQPRGRVKEMGYRTAARALLHLQDARVSRGDRHQRNCRPPVRRMPHMRRR